MEQASGTKKDPCANRGLNTNTPTKEIFVMNIVTAPQATSMEQPAGFKFNHRAYAECGVASWAGPTASTTDETLSVRFEWDPAAGIVATLDVTAAGEYTLEHMRELHAALGAALNRIHPTLEAALANLDEVIGYDDITADITPDVGDALLAVGQALKRGLGQ